MKDEKRRTARAENLKPFAKKSFGQNFLIDAHYVEKIVGALDPQPGETVIEIGAGRGALTEKLIDRGARLIAIELDRDLIAPLGEKFGSRDNFKLVESDALKIDFSSFTLPPSSLKLKLVANLPYNISTAILQRLIEQRACFSEMVLMFQREVVERITAQPGSSERGFLTVLTEACLDAENLFDVPPRAFRPAPKVWSAVVRLVPKADVQIKDEKLFREFVGAAFRQKRKTIYNNLKNAPVLFRGESNFGDKLTQALESSGIKPERRAETLSFDEWRNLFNRLETKSNAERVD